MQKHINYLISNTVLLDQFTFQLKNPPCFYKIEVASLTLSGHILLRHIRGRLMWKG